MISANREDTERARFLPRINRCRASSRVTGWDARFLNSLIPLLDAGTPLTGYQIGELERIEYAATFRVPFSRVTPR